MKYYSSYEYIISWQVLTECCRVPIIWKLKFPVRFLLSNHPHLICFLTRKWEYTSWTFLFLILNDTPIKNFIKYDFTFHTRYMSFFLKMGQSTPLFCLFSSFSCYKFNNTNWKTLRWCAWNSNPGPHDGSHRQNHGAMAATPEVHQVYVMLWHYLQRLSPMSFIYLF